MGLHKSSEQVKAEIERASGQIKIGGTYRHYKAVHKLYKVLDFVLLEATNELCVLYQALYDDGFKFVRPVSVWLEKVEWNGQTVPRFVLVD